MKKIIGLIVILICQVINSQTKNFIDKPYLETIVKVDTLIKPDLIFLNIRINENDKRNKISIEELERKMFKKFKSLNIDISKQLKVSNLGSGFVKYFLRKKEITKNMTYELEIYDTQTASNVLTELEKIGISNINLYKTEYSKMEQLKINLKVKAIEKAKKQAELMIKPLNQKLKKAIYISDIEKNNNRYLKNNDMHLNEVASTGFSKFKKEYKRPTIQIRPIKVISSVNVIFEIE